MTDKDLQRSIKQLEEENELMLAQFRLAQEELQHYFQMYQESERQVTELTRRIEAPQFSVSRKSTLLTKLTDMLGFTIQNQIDAVKASGLFDEAWYLAEYPDVTDGMKDPVEHYLRYGAAEGRNPGPNFDTHWYINSNPDVRGKNINPLLHYASFGKAEGREPCRGGIKPLPEPFSSERKWLKKARDEQAQLAEQLQAQVTKQKQAEAELQREKSALEGQRIELEQEVSVLSQEKVELEQEQSEQQRLLAEYKDRLQLQEKEVGENNAQQQRVQEELIRAEVQIDLIRNIFWPGLDQ